MSSLGYLYGCCALKSHGSNISISHTRSYKYEKQRSNIVLNKDGHKLNHEPEKNPMNWGASQIGLWPSLWVSFC